VGEEDCKGRYIDPAVLPPQPIIPFDVQWKQAKERMATMRKRKGSDPLELSEIQVSPTPERVSLRTSGHFSSPVSSPNVREVVETWRQKIVRKAKQFLPS
jgi:hypothetical protein